MASVLKDNLKPTAHNPRIISGNVLTGRKTPADGFIGFYANMVTVIPEGNHYELLGWAMPRLNKFSVSRAYFHGSARRRFTTWIPISTAASARLW